MEPPGVVVVGCGVGKGEPGGRGSRALAEARPPACPVQVAAPPVAHHARIGAALFLLS